MEFRPTAELDDDVLVEHDDDLAVADPRRERRDAARVPRSPSTAAWSCRTRTGRCRPSRAVADRPEADLSGEVPQRVIQVLEEQINPAIASHGGYAELVAVEDSIAYLRLGGGCQGCGMAAVTLSQGIEVAILDIGARRSPR